MCDLSVHCEQATGANVCQRLPVAGAREKNCCRRSPWNTRIAHDDSIKKITHQKPSPVTCQLDVVILSSFQRGCSRRVYFSSAQQGDVLWCRCQFQCKSDHALSLLCKSFPEVCTCFWLWWQQSGEEQRNFEGNLINISCYTHGSAGETVVCCAFSYAKAQSFDDRLIMVNHGIHCMVMDSGSTTSCEFSSQLCATSV